MNDNTKDLFPITQAAKVCGLSRSTLLRLEERGLLIPAYIAPKSGRRYYDNYNISRILQIRKFQQMGFDTDDITAYYAGRGKADELLASLEKKLSALQASVEEMRLRAHDIPDMSVSVIKVPEIVCCTRRFQGASVQNKYDAMYAFFNECVQKGIALTSEPLFIINERTDYLEGMISSAPFDSYACIPIAPKQDLLSGQDLENVLRLPACTALSLLFYGDFSNLDDALLYLGEQVRQRGLTPIGYIRGGSLVGPYVGREIDPKRYCSQFILPVREPV